MSVPAIRLSLLQALSFGAMGAVLPFLALELRAGGVGPVGVTVAMVSVPVASLLLGPVWGWASDRAGQLRGGLALAGIFAVLGATVLVGLPVWMAVVGALLFAVGRSGLSPLVEAASLHSVGRDPGRYARLRRWGSAGFLASVLFSGLMRDYLGLSSFWLGLGLGTGVLAMVWALPAAPARTGEPLGPALAQLVRDPVVALILVASALHFSGIAIYDGFFAVHLEGLGHGTTWVGVAAVLGIGVEVGVLSLAAWMVRRAGPSALFVGAMLLNVPRWAVMIFWTDPFWVVPIQAVHGLAFGAFWVAAIALISARAPSRLVGSVQGLLAAAAGGVGAGLGNGLGSALIATGDSWRLFSAALVLASSATVVAAVAVLLHDRTRPQSTRDGLENAA